MVDTERRYRAFLLRLWQERSGSQWVWRASLEDPYDNSRRGFRDLERLSAFLQELTEDAPNEEN